MAAHKKHAAKTKRKSAKGSATAAKRKTSVKKVKGAVSRATSKKTTAKAAVKPVSVGNKPFTKSEFLTTVSEHTGLSRKEVGAVFESMGSIIKGHIQKQGPGVFSLPGLLKIQIVKKPATKAREGISPFTGEKMMFKAKPASRRVKIRALKQLKAMVN
jgi:nucleoid DNA-binding protein